MAIKNVTALAKHIRGRVKASGIKARVRIAPGSRDCIQVFPPAYEIHFTEAEQREIRLIAVVNGMTLVRGMPIAIEQMTDPCGMNFYTHGPA